MKELGLVAKPIPEQQKSAFLSKADVNHLPSFLASVFLYAVQQPNKLKKNPIPITPTDHSVCTITDGRIYLDGEEVNKARIMELTEEQIETVTRVMRQSSVYVVTKQTDLSE